MIFCLRHVIIWDQFLFYEEKLQIIILSLHLRLLLDIQMPPKEKTDM